MKIVLNLFITQLLDFLFKRISRRQIKNDTTELNFSHGKNIVGKGENTHNVQLFFFHFA